MIMSDYGSGTLSTAIISFIRQKHMKEVEKDELEIYKEMLNEKVDYQEYIKSHEWQETSRKAKIRAGYHCQMCHAEGNDSTLNTHHNNYERLGLEFDSDLIVLCRKCHRKHHNKISFSKDGEMIYV